MVGTGSIVGNLKADSMSKLTVIKIGGNIVDDATRLDAFLKDFAALDGWKILVHGGGKIATEIGNRLGIESKYVDGRRITDKPTLELVTMVYGGLINKKIVAQLQAIGCNAIGLAGSDANVITANKRPVKIVDYGFVGDVKSSGVNVGVLKGMLELGLTPVLAPLTHDGAGCMLNTNADTIAQETARALSTVADVELIYCFEKSGVLRDPDDDASGVPQIKAEDFETLKATGIVSGGMIPKLENAFSALQSGVKKVIIGKAEELPQLITGNSGTQIL